MMRLVRLALSCYAVGFVLAFAVPWTVDLMAHLHEGCFACV